MNNYLENGTTNAVFPITIIVLAVALMCGDRCAALISICQGEKDDECITKIRFKLRYTN